MLMHGYCPGDLLMSNIVSIPKIPEESLSSGENCRGISLSNAFTKVLDLIIIEKCSNAFEISNLQYGFKERHSTVMCVTVFKELYNIFWIVELKFSVAF